MDAMVHYPQVGRLLEGTVDRVKAKLGSTPMRLAHHIDVTVPISIAAFPLTARPCAAFPLTARPSAAFPLAAKLPLLLQGGLMANLDASLPTREQLAMKSTAPNGFTVHARSRPRLRRLPCIHRLCVANRSQSRLATGGGRRLGRGEC